MHRPMVPSEFGQGFERQNEVDLHFRARGRNARADSHIAHEAPIFGSLLLPAWGPDVCACAEFLGGPSRLAGMAWTSPRDRTVLR